MVIVIIMGVVLSIASFTYFGAVESRRVDSATNQVVADLRLAHTQAKNRLIDTSFVVPADAVPPGFDPLSTYQVGPPEDPEDIDTMTLPGGDQGVPMTKFGVPTTITFHSDGSAEIDPAGNITVTTTDGDPDDPSHTINVNTVTSRVKVVN
jgi:type IV fimbrial biogenesis protein FimT